jgi:hypothetical protein
MAKVKSKRAYWGIMGASALSMLLTQQLGMSSSDAYAAAQRPQARASATLEVGDQNWVVAPDTTPPPTPCNPGKGIFSLVFILGQQGDTGEFQCFCGAQEVATAKATASTQTTDGTGYDYGVGAGNGKQVTGNLSGVTTQQSNPKGFVGGLCLPE